MTPFDLLKNTQAIKEQTEKLKEELASIRVEGSSGGKMVVVTMNGQFEMIDIKLDPICVDNRDVQMLQDLIVAASHDAMEKIKDGMKDKLGGLNIPGLNL